MTRPADVTGWLSTVATVQSVLAVAIAATNRPVLGRLAAPASVIPGSAIPAPGVPGTVTVCVPARDERHRIAGLIEDLCGQVGVRDMRIVVYDDDSSDGTADVVRRTGRDDPRVAIIDGGATPPPAGWTGKAWALHRSTWAMGSGLVCMVDADVRLAPDAIATAVATFTDLELRGSGKLGVLSLWPRQVGGTFLTDLMQPLLCWSWFATVPMRLSENTFHPASAVANGQFLVTTADRLRHVGGYRSVASEAADDLALARVFRRAGMRTVIRCAGATASCRMYRNGQELRRGYSRWLAAEFGSPAAATAIAGVAIGAVWPAVALSTGRRRRSATVALTAGIASRLLTRSAESGRAGWDRTDVLVAALHPLAVVAGAALVADSGRRRRAGAAEWKGRPLPGS